MLMQLFLSIRMIFYFFCLFLCSALVQFVLYALALKTDFGMGYFSFLEMLTKITGVGQSGLQMILIMMVLSIIYMPLRYIGFDMLKDHDLTLKRVGLTKSLAATGCIAIVIIYLLTLGFVAVFVLRSGLAVMVDAGIFNLAGWVSLVSNPLFSRYILAFMTVALLLEYTYRAFKRLLFAETLEPKYAAIVEEERKARLPDDREKSSEEDYNDIVDKTKDLGKFEPQTYFEDDAIFLAMDIDNKMPVTVEMKLIRDRKLRHFAILGASGSGKGVFSQVFLIQMLMKHIASVVFDPNNDEHLMKNLYHWTRILGRNFHYIDFRKHNIPQVDLLQGADRDDFIELTNGMFAYLQYGEGGADYYASFSRQARDIYEEFVESSSCLLDLHTKAENSGNLSQTVDKDDNLPTFYRELGDIASLPIICTNDGVDIKKAIDNGDVVYISCTNMAVKDKRSVACKSLFMRILQIIKKRDEKEAKHVCVFIDEFAEFTNALVKSMLEQVRKKGCTMLMNMTAQSIDDKNKDIKAEAFLDSMDVNTYKLIYETPSAKLAEKVSKMTGKKKITVNSNRSSTNEAMQTIADNDETHGHERMVPTYSSTTIENLPEQVGICLGFGMPKLVQTAVLKYPEDTPKPEIKASTLFSKPTASAKI